MEKMLTGIRSTGTPHLGNILGVIIPSVSIANKKKKYTSFIFIADLHSMIQIENIKEIKDNTYQIAAAWLAFGLNTKNCFFFKQSDISEVTELAWYFSCFFPYQRLTLAHSFKEEIKKDKGRISVGLFTYPILMAADILLYNAEIIPVGKDQLQHIEITRRIASHFNKKIGKKLFILPNAFLQKETMSVLGTDGNKMSKSGKNWINIFSEENILKKQIMSIRTDSKSLEEKKDPKTNYIMSLFRMIANSEKIDTKYTEGRYGYLEAKIGLYEHIIHKFSKERKRFFSFMKKKSLLDDILYSGAKKAKNIAMKRLNYIRKNLKFNSII
ncbi:tryptophan--tRNA ligase [Blattabacterium cuenoti]|uniref:tryptophan--tRNA ligase n=1 Tax=Blattabacterium cuenoti TaxID=1653831 RepID=UPI00163B7A4C|nr:tryptophan--tRNA ligase [Blattabacterium cuenoti]